MACSLETIETYMEALPDARPWEVDQHVAPVPWRNSLATPGARRLKIGFVIDDGVVKVQPPIARAMKETIEALKQAGHEGTHFITTLQPMWKILTGILQCSNGMLPRIPKDMISGQRPFSPMVARAVGKRQK